MQRRAQIQEQLHSDILGSQRVFVDGKELGFVSMYGQRIWRSRPSLQTLHVLWADVLGHYF